MLQLLEDIGSTLQDIGVDTNFLKIINTQKK